LSNVNGTFGNHTRVFGEKYDRNNIIIVRFFSIIDNLIILLFNRIYNCITIFFFFKSRLAHESRSESEVEVFSSGSLVPRISRGLTRPADDVPPISRQSAPRQLCWVFRGHIFEPSWQSRLFLVNRSHHTVQRWETFGKRFGLRRDR